MVVHCQPVVDFLMSKSDLTAYILAGGSSRRMGTDKLFLDIDGQSLLNRVLSSCDACFEQVKLVAGDSAKFSSFDHPVVLDSTRAKGPMAGIIAALEDCQAEYCFVTAADLPDLNEQVIISLINQHNGGQYLGLHETDGLQPLCGIYHKSALKILYQFAQNKKLSMRAAVAAMDHDCIAIPPGQWRNINSPIDLTTGNSHD